MKSPQAPVTLRPVVVVLGSGRSGTSLLMQALAALGMRVSREMIEARSDNPQGFYEDAPIVRIQADLLRALGAWPYHPLPPDWLNHPATGRAASLLQEVLADRLARDDGLWGFKDPRTASFLPLWQPLFDSLGLIPLYLLAVRHPGSIVRSFMAVYATPPETAELIWLRRTRDALCHSRADCHIVHYEDWFIRPEALVDGLARWIGLPATPRLRVPSEFVRADLNRADGREWELRNPHAQALYAALCACRGEVGDRNRLLQIAAGCQA